MHQDSGTERWESAEEEQSVHFADDFDKSGHAESL